MKTALKNLLRIGFPLLLAGAILYWMYDGVDWGTVWKALDGGMNWWWMLLSMPFGVSAQVFRAMRWKVALKPLGETPRLSTCCNCIFLSYASSLIIPRVGEVLRCGILSRYENIAFPRLLGSVVSERVVDMSMVFLFSSITVITQIHVFLDFFDETGVGYDAFHLGLTDTGCIVASVCVLSAVAIVCLLLKRVGLFARTKARLAGLMDGMTAVTRLQNPWLFLLYSVGIWGSYYMHFYVTFYCMDYTAGLGPVAALVAFVVGCFAVLVPTPNGAGPWHFVVKTVLVLYGVQDNDAAVFVLIVHTLQTMLTVLLGLYALAALAVTRVADRAVAATSDATASDNQTI